MTMDLIIMSIKMLQHSRIYTFMMKKKVQVGHDQEMGNQKEIPTP